MQLQPRQLNPNPIPSSLIQTSQIYPLSPSPLPSPPTIFPAPPKTHPPLSNASSPPPQSPPNRSRRHTPSHLHPSTPLILIPTLCSPTTRTSSCSSRRHTTTTSPIIITTTTPAPPILQDRLRSVPAHRSSPFGGEVETDGFLWRRLLFGHCRRSGPKIWGVFPLDR